MFDPMKVYISGLKTLKICLVVDNWIKNKLTTISGVDVVKAKTINKLLKYYQGFYKFSLVIEFKNLTVYLEKNILYRQKLCKVDCIKKSNK